MQRIDFKLSDSLTKYIFRTKRRSEKK
jgi:hypothetical protein